MDSEVPLNSSTKGCGGWPSRGACWLSGCGICFCLEQQESPRRGSTCCSDSKWPMVLFLLRCCLLPCSLPHPRQLPPPPWLLLDPVSSVHAQGTGKCAQASSRGWGQTSGSPPSPPGGNAHLPGGSRRAGSRRAWRDPHLALPSGDLRERCSPYSLRLRAEPSHAGRSGHLSRGAHRDHSFEDLVAVGWLNGRGQGPGCCRFLKQFGKQCRCPVKGGNCARDAQGGWATAWHTAARLPCPLVSTWSLNSSASSHLEKAA